MNSVQKLSFVCFFLQVVYGVDDDAHLSNLLNAVKGALYSSASLDNLYRRPQDLYSSSNGISLGVYEALLSITRNDDLECVPRLLCEAAAGGRPGYSGRDIKFDKNSLTKFISYLNLGSSKTSPLLTFAKAALLGVSNRGDPYSCIINYSKCPKDQSRLLHYLNNHRGGFFQYFDRQDHQQTRPYRYEYHSGYRDDYRPIKYKKNRIKFESSNFYNNLKKKATSGTGAYAKRYPYLSFKFPRESYDFKHTSENDYRKKMIFPGEDDKGRRGRSELVGDPRIINQAQKGTFSFEPSKSPTRYPKKLTTNSYFFPETDLENEKNVEQYGGGLVTDRLPPRFHFPLSEEKDSPDENSFFPK